MLAALTAGTVALRWLVPEFLSAYLQRLWYSGVYLLDSPNLVLSRRLESWQLLLGYVREHPWQMLFGIGYKTLPYTDLLGRPVVADNTYLSLLVETGVLGPGRAPAAARDRAGGLLPSCPDSLRRAKLARAETPGSVDVLFLVRAGCADVERGPAHVLEGAARALWPSLPWWCVKRTMRILFLDQFSELGGAQRCLLELFPVESRAGWEAHAALPGSGPLVRLLEQRSVPVHRLSLGNYALGRKGSR